MVLISTYSAFWQWLAGQIGGIDHVLIVHENSDLEETIRNYANGAVILLAVAPSSDMEATSTDDYEEIDTCYIFLVKKTYRGDMTHTEWLADLETMQVKLGAIKQKMILLSGDTAHAIHPEHSHLMHRLMINGIHTDPEYDLYGCNGYGMMFKLKTPGTLV